MSLPSSKALIASLIMGTPKTISNGSFISYILLAQKVRYLLLGLAILLNMFSKLFRFVKWYTIYF